MNPRILSLLSVTLLHVTAATGIAQSISFTHPEQMVVSVDSLVSLSADQKPRITEIVNRTMAALGALSPAERLQDFTILAKMRADIREVLTPEQRKKYDRAPQTAGGGLTLAKPENKLDRLDQLVALTTEQKGQAIKIFTTEFETLLELPEAERGVGGMTVRKATREAIRTILKPEQQAKYDAAPQSKGGGSMKPPRS